ncbi:MAG: site-specific integrase [Mesorhizobium sp.]|uniref:site-specific integrase n=1 Tax=Mesorhizobium sp. TaxID=1871066 RepID=UPI000FE2F6EA|nr:site-specific integrase [Mesorhizobium sp.]RWH50243.1 MAG: site-specific integrase [Mesorhizobium sp.]RWH52290.1 MAG: site-specific integrase [Mesorhizobium sp.]RWI47596.1 MAG: site-specific integrase [Mesorhizobium sp.]RWI69677.1 MAG: site-specific integrase [Mesorhizobium sp.]RWI76144.1 MAG: site-specific integrase [Mesorhizobium sp.]
MADIYIRERSTTYQARLKVGDQIVRRSTGLKCPKAAQTEADRLEKELNDALVLDSDVTIIKATERLFEHPRRKPYSKNTKRHYTTSLTNIVEVLGNFPLRVLDEAKVQTYIKTKLKTGKTVQLRRDLAFLSLLLTYAKRRLDCGVTYNVVKEIDKGDIPDADKREVYLQQHHYDKLLAACKSPEHRLFIILAVWTGMRHQEILKLQWDEINPQLTAIQLDGERVKNSSSRRIPLRQDVRDTLSNTPEAQRVGYVFKGKKEGKPQYSFSKRWLGIRKRAGMPRLHIHDLRHTFASWLLQSGVADKTTQDLMGHKTDSMTRRYSHNSLKSLKKAIDQMEADTL